MSYRTTATGTTSLAGSTPVVLLSTSLLTTINTTYAADYGLGTVSGGHVSSAWTYAVNAAGVFTFHHDVAAFDSHGQPIAPVDAAFGPPLALLVVTLDGALVGEQVLIDTGGNKWKVATVTADGSSITSPAGTIPTSARAAPVPIGAVLDASLALVGSSVDGHTWFSGTLSGAVYAGPLTTAGAVAAGVQALVEVKASPSTWVLVTL